MWRGWVRRLGWCLAHARQAESLAAARVAEQEAAVARLEALAETLRAEAALRRVQLDADVQGYGAFFATLPPDRPRPH